MSGLQTLIKIVTEFFLKKIKGSLTIDFDGSGKYSIKSNFSQDSTLKILDIKND